MNEAQVNIATERGFRYAQAWTRNTLNSIADGGVWVIPRTGAMVRILSHKKLEATMTHMDREVGIVTMMRSLGWQVKAEKK
jgi:hypothetical protein